ncbi:hypothetical protein [Actinomadura parmotrematis]|uniref:Uncharacterized protein n=1 Tax=Actinomadura parmotrematis TaxID=2864039 RepID=A0ABS7FU36_9ACTN|nr:hypothetical protein [Actinomadura parmotrematis]MBW8483102.1 hypothetical protein [Actinomadura parmotrematis]
MRSLVWLMMGSTGSVPGELHLSDGRLVFEAYGRGALTGGQLRELEARAGRPGLGGHLDAGRAGVVFDAPVDAVGAVSFPWYYFGGGMRLRVGEAPYRFSFLQPQNTRLPGDLRGAGDIPAGRAAGRGWKQALRR